MYVQQIQLTNFQSYYGSDNRLEFEQGLNVVVGSINKGKSKLFDAFYWVLFGKIFITGNDWVDTNRLAAKSSFINDRARFLAEPGDTITTCVELTICHQEGDSLPVDYTFCRTVSATRRTDNMANWYDDRAWQVSNSRVELRYTKDHNLEIVDTQVGFEDELRRLFPKEIRNYVWFQGEALDKLIDFSNQATFEQAINYISYYPRYETLSKLIELTVEIIDKEKRKKERENTTDTKQYESDEKELDKKKNELSQFKQDLEDLKKTKSEASQLKDAAEAILKALHEFPPLEKRQAQAEANRKIARERIDREIDQQKVQFQKTWLLKGISGLAEQAKKIMLDYEIQRTSGTKYVLPADVPAKHYMEKMLTEGQCLICGTDAPEGSAPHEHIRQRIDAQESYYKQIKDNQELYSSVQQLIGFPDEITATVAGIDEQIKATEEQIEAAMKERNKANAAYLEVTAEIDSLIAKYNLSLSDGVSQSNAQVNKMTSMGDLLSNTIVRIGKKEEAIRDHERTIKTLQDKLSATTLSGDVVIPEKRWYELATYMAGVVKNVKKQAKTEMIRLIGQKANEYYATITSHNKGVWGQIAISPTTYKVERVVAGGSDNDYQAQAMATSIYTLMKMCVINAMLNLNEEVSRVAYPFIADAPTSNFDDETTIAYLKSLANSFGQSIIITKDIDQVRLKEVKSDSKIRTLYTLETYSENPDAEQLTQYEAYTKIKRIK